MFKRLSKKRQIFIATQSPYLVDCFELENIIIASADHGETTLRNLPREQYQEWLADEYQLSDIWLKNSWIGGNAYALPPAHALPIAVKFGTACSYRIGRRVSKHKIEIEIVSDDGDGDARFV